MTDVHRHAITIMDMIQQGDTYANYSFGETLSVMILSDREGLNDSGSFLSLS